MSSWSCSWTSKTFGVRLHQSKLLQVVLVQVLESGQHKPDRPDMPSTWRRLHSRYGEYVDDLPYDEQPFPWQSSRGPTQLHPTRVPWQMLLLAQRVSRLWSMFLTPPPAHQVRDAHEQDFWFSSYRASTSGESSCAFSSHLASSPS